MKRNIFKIIGIFALGLMLFACSTTIPENLSEQGIVFYDGENAVSKLEKGKDYILTPTFKESELVSKIIVNGEDVTDKLVNGKYTFKFDGKIPEVKIERKEKTPILNFSQDFIITNINELGDPIKYNSLVKFEVVEKLGKEIKEIKLNGVSINKKEFNIKEDSTLTVEYEDKENIKLAKNDDVIYLSESDPTSTFTTAQYNSNFIIQIKNKIGSEVQELFINNEKVEIKLNEKGFYTYTFKQIKKEFDLKVNYKEMEDITLSNVENIKYYSKIDNDLTLINDLKIKYLSNLVIEVINKPKFKFNQLKIDNNVVEVKQEEKITYEILEIKKPFTVEPTFKRTHGGITIKLNGEIIDLSNPLVKWENKDELGNDLNLIQVGKFLTFTLTPEFGFEIKEVRADNELKDLNDVSGSEFEKTFKLKVTKEHEISIVTEKIVPRLENIASFFEVIVLDNNIKVGGVETDNVVIEKDIKDFTYGKNYYLILNGIVNTQLIYLDLLELNGKNITENVKDVTITYTKPSVTEGELDVQAKKYVTLVPFSLTKKENILNYEINKYLNFEIKNITEDFTSYLKLDNIIEKKGKQYIKYAKVTNYNAEKFEHEFEIFEENFFNIKIENKPDILKYRSAKLKTRDGKVFIDLKEKLDSTYDLTIDLGKKSEKNFIDIMNTIFLELDVYDSEKISLNINIKFGGSRFNEKTSYFECSNPDIIKSIKGTERDIILNFKNATLNVLFKEEVKNTINEDKDYLLLVYIKVNGEDKTEEFKNNKINITTNTNIEVLYERFFILHDEKFAPWIKDYRYVVTLEKLEKILKTGWQHSISDEAKSIKGSNEYEFIQNFNTEVGKEGSGKKYELKEELYNDLKAKVDKFLNDLSSTSELSPLESSASNIAKEKELIKLYYTCIELGELIKTSTNR